MNHAELGPIQHVAENFGSSVKGIPLEIFQPVNQPARILVMASIHGDESISTVLVSECLRMLAPQSLKAAVVPSVNPDGVLLGTRCNANGVDLNRNYPTQNWEPDPVYYRNSPGGPQNIALSPGSRGGSEPETQAMIRLIQALKPALIVSIHGFLACIDDPDSTDLAIDMAKRTNMELVPDVGYATPGSFGSWCAEQDIPIITYELPSLGMVEMREIHRPVFLDLISGAYDDKV